VSAREEILARVRTALAAEPAERAVPGADGAARLYLRSHADADLTGLFAERVADYRAVVSRVPAERRAGRHRFRGRNSRARRRCRGAGISVIVAAAGGRGDVAGRRSAA